MKLALVPMLQLQRNLYDIPRGWERFRAYLASMIGDTTDLALPLPGLSRKAAYAQWVACGSEAEQHAIAAYLAAIAQGGDRDASATCVDAY